MTSAQYRKLLERLGLTIVGAAPVLGISRRQAQRYAEGNAIPGPVAKLVWLMADRGIDPNDVMRLKP